MDSFQKQKNTELIKNKARELGFMYCGVSKARRLNEEEPHLQKWLQQEKHGKMHYMENHYEKRLDPTKLVPGSKSVVSLLYNYYTEKEQEDPNAPKISKYAYGKDYHFLLKRKLKEFMNFIQNEIGDVNGRVFVDSAPVLDRAWAKQSGLGWVGKNTMLINKEHGSYFFIAELILDLELDTDGPIKDYCGTCTRCIDACPTEAITPYKVDASKCISYLTIELKDELLPSEYKGKMENWAFGCDICQEVCPWNSKAIPHEEPFFEPHEELLQMSKVEWEEITEEIFREIFRKSAVKRTKYKGLKRNIKFLKD